MNFFIQATYTQRVSANSAFFIMSSFAFNKKVSGFGEISGELNRIGQRNHSRHLLEFGTLAHRTHKNFYCKLKMAFSLCSHLLNDLSGELNRT